MCIHTFFFSHTIFHCGLSQENDYSSLCCSVGLHCLSILNGIVGTYQPQTPCSSHSLALFFFFEAHYYLSTLTSLMWSCIRIATGVSRCIAIEGCPFPSVFSFLYCPVTWGRLQMLTCVCILWLQYVSTSIGWHTSSVFIRISVWVFMEVPYSELGFAFRGQVKYFDYV